MKAKLIFNLPEDQAKYEMVNSARNYLLVIEDMYEYLRRQEKYVDPKDIDDIGKIREEFRVILGDRGVEI